MKKAILTILGIAVLVAPAAVGFAQGKKPTAAYYITKEEVDTVNKTPGVDRTIKVWSLDGGLSTCVHTILPPLELIVDGERAVCWPFARGGDGHADVVRAQQQAQRERRDERALRVERGEAPEARARELGDERGGDDGGGVRRLHVEVEGEHAIAEERGEEGGDAELADQGLRDDWIRGIPGFPAG